MGKNYSLESHGFNNLTEREQVACLGPPLDLSFSMLSGSDDTTLIASLVAKYRERYAVVGYAESSFYGALLRCSTISALLSIYP